MPTKYLRVRTVTVQEGETLWGIAERELGDGQRWRDVFAWNVVDLVEMGEVPSKIGPNFLWPGMDLRVLIDDPEFEPSGN